jgi:hypothetical protein
MARSRGLGDVPVRPPLGAGLGMNTGGLGEVRVAGGLWDDLPPHMLIGSNLGAERGTIPLPMAAGGRSKSKSDGKTYWDEISKTKLKVPLEDMTATYRDTGDLAPYKTISPEQLEGKILTPLIGDRTIAGRALTGINGKSFENEVPLQGGYNFMRGPHEGVWASKSNVIGTIAKRVAKLGADGQDVAGVYSSMAARSSDFATMTTHALMEQMKSAKVLVKDKKAFDADMRAAFAKDDIKVPWPGIDKVTPEWIKKAGTGRTILAQMMATGKHQGKGFPDVGSTRFALTEPGLLSTQSGMTGHGVSLLGSKPIKNPRGPHDTYDTQLGGTYLGGLPPVPREVMFPDWVKEWRPQMKDSAQEDYTFGRKMVSQKADAKWLENIMTYLKSREGLSLGIGGAIAAGLLTEQEAAELVATRPGV